MARARPKHLSGAAFAITVIALTLLFVATWRWIEHARSELTARFGRERLEHVRSVARTMGEDVRDIDDDLRFAAHLTQVTSSPAARAQALGALLGSVRAYRAATIYSPGGGLVLEVRDPRGDDVIGPSLAAAMAHTARAALESPIDVETSLPLARDSEGEATFRVFARALPAGKVAPHGGAISLLVDTSQVLENLRLIAADPQTQLLLLGPHGRAAPISSLEVLSAMTAGQLRPALGELVSRMRSGESGTLQLDAAQASVLGFGPADVSVAYAPIPIAGGRHWSVATLTTMEAVRTHEAAVIWRLAVLAAVAATLLVGFTAYAALSRRQQAILEAELEHATELAHVHEKADKILDSIPIGVLLLTGDRRIARMNRAFRTRLGHAPVGAPMPAAFPRASAASGERLETLVAAACETNETRSLHGEHLTLFGDEGHYSVHAVPLVPASDNARALLVIEDLTEVHRLESQLVTAEKLTTVGILAAGIAHEIGTPLGIVRGRAEYILGKLGSSHSQASGLRIIVEQIDRVTRSILELLDFSRGRAAAVAPVELAPLIDKSLELLRFEAERRQVTITVVVAEALPALAADADQLQQVLVNLMMNALDACQAGGHVAVSAEAVAVADRTPSARLVVADDGCGIPEEDQNRIFDPFFTTKKRGRGTGLGLSIVNSIARSHGAQVQLTSEPGRGTRVCLMWPLASAQEARSAG